MSRTMDHAGLLANGLDLGVNVAVLHPAALFTDEQGIIRRHSFAVELNESPKSLDVRGLIERQTDKRNQAFVRLSDQNYLSSGRVFDVHRAAGSHPAKRSRQG